MINKALQSIINKIYQFKRKYIISYLRYYVKKMDLKCIFEKEMIQLFELVFALEINLK